MLIDKKIEYQKGISTVDSMFAGVKEAFTSALDTVQFENEITEENLKQIDFKVLNDNRKYRIILSIANNLVIFNVVKIKNDGSIYDKEVYTYTHNNTTGATEAKHAMGLALSALKDGYFYIRFVKGKTGSLIITLMKDTAGGYGIRENCLKIFKVFDFESGNNKYISAQSHYYINTNYDTDKRYGFVSAEYDPIANPVNSSRPTDPMLTDNNMFSLELYDTNISVNSLMAASLITPVIFKRVGKDAAYATDVFYFKDLVGQNFGVIKSVVNGINRTFYKFDNNLIIEIE